MLSVQKPVTACPFSSSLSFDASATCSHASPSNYISTATGIYPDLELDEPQQDNYPVPRPTVLFPPLSLPTPSPHQSIDAASASLLSSLISSFEITSPDGKPHSRPYFQAFSFSQLRLPRDTQREWYCVFFRSTKRLEGDRVGVDELYLADKIAYTEAVKSGGLLMYWYGVPDPISGDNLATCIWESRTQARQANANPEHVKAAQLASRYYKSYRLERWVLRKVAGEDSVRLEPWVDGEVGWPSH